MKQYFSIAVLTFLLISSPAQATGGLACRTAGDEPIIVSLGFGHVPSAGLFLARLVEGRKEIAVTATQWWLSASELRLALVSPDAITEELILIASWNEARHTYDGSVWRAGRQRWVRCREA